MEVDEFGLRVGRWEGDSFHHRSFEVADDRLASLLERIVTAFAVRGDLTKGRHMCDPQPRIRIPLQQDLESLHAAFPSFVIGYIMAARGWTIGDMVGPRRTTDGPTFAPRLRPQRTLSRQPPPTWSRPQSSARPPPAPVIFSSSAAVGAAHVEKRTRSILWGVRVQKTAL